LILSQRAREDQARVDAEKLAEERRLAREQALEWTREVRMDSDDDQEREKRPKRSKKAKADGSGDEEQKKKKRGKIKKSGNEQGDEDQAMLSDEDDAEKLTKKVRNPKSDFMARVYHLFSDFPRNEWCEMKMMMKLFLILAKNNSEFLHCS